VNDLIPRKQKRGGTVPCDRCAELLGLRALDPVMKERRVRSGADDVAPIHASDGTVQVQ